MHVPLLEVCTHMISRLILVAGMAGFAALAQQPGPPPESSHELGPGNHFLIQAVRGSRTNVELGQLAQKHASDPAVKNFANQMVQSGNSMLQSLQGIAASETVAIPKLPSPGAVAQMQQLEQLQGTRFDQAYVHFMVDQLKKEAGQLQEESQKGVNPKLKGFATANLPGVKKALSQAQQIEQQLNANSNSSPGRM